MNVMYFSASFEKNFENKMFEIYMFKKVLEYSFKYKW